MYSAIIQDSSFDIELGKTTVVYGSVQECTLEFGGKDAYFFTMHGKKIIADVVKIDLENKQVVLRVQGKKIAVQIKEPVDILLDKLGIVQSQTKKVNHLKSPMPGLVLKVIAKVGDIVKQGEPLLILEAMKMENVFKAPSDVVIKSIDVTEKQAVEKGELLISFV